MLNKRFEYNKKPAFNLNLNRIQLKYKHIVENKVGSNKYQFEKVNCVVCGNKNFELLSEKDRYGLYVPTVICKDCGLVQTNPRMNQKSYNEFYDSEYRRLYTGEDICSEAFFKNQQFQGKAIFDLIEKYIGKPLENKFVVEIGTGAGGILQIFKDIGNKVFGLDLGSEYINYGKSKGLNLKVGTIDDIKKLKLKPDLVIYSHVLEHILDPVRELKKLRENLKPTSLLYIEVPGIKNLIKSYNQDFLTYLQNAHVYHFSLKTLKNIGRKAGFSCVYGNEGINSIFKTDKIDNRYDNDYNDTIYLLRKLERLRISPFNLYGLRNLTFSLLIFVFKKTGTLDIARKFYHSLKYKKF